VFYKRNYFSWGLVIGSLAGLLFGFPCHAQRDDPNHGAGDAALRKVLRQYVKDQDVEHENTVRYVAAFVDLNDDGVKEVIVHVMCQSLCGTGGCPTLVLVPAQSSFRIVSRIPLTRPPIRVLGSKSKGWHDLGVWVAGGGIQPGYEADLPFDGETYAANPTVPLAHSLRSKSDGRIVISDNAVATPLD
jgi:hypothetical protein